MSQCSKELDPLFEEIGTHALILKTLKKDTPEWEAEDEYLDEAYKQAKKIFNFYNPDYKANSEPDKADFLQAKRKRDKA